MTTPDERLFFQLWRAAESDADRYKGAWQSARARAAKSRAANRALGNENDDLHARLRAELDRNKALILRCHEADTEIARLKARRSAGWGQQ